MRWKVTFAVFVVGAFSAVIAYYATLPVPSELSDRRGELRIIAAMTHTFRFLYPYIPLDVWNWMLRSPPITPVPDFNVTETVLDGDIPLIIYRPLKSSKERPLSAVLWLHGGGWMYGSVYLSHVQVSNMARELDDSVIISIGYRLAPMNIFPAAIDDVTKATVWILRHLEELNIDPERVVVMGESAGGNLAAALSQRLTFDPLYKNLPKLRAQLLINPVLQMFDFKTPSYTENSKYNTLLLDTLWMAQFWNNYMTGNEDLVPKMLENQHISTQARKSPFSKLVSHDLLPRGFRKTGDSLHFSSADDSGDENIYDEIADTILNPDFAPLMRPLLLGLPEAYIATAEFDVLRDDGVLYAKRLEADGVLTTWKNYDSILHGEFSISLSRESASPRNISGTIVGDILQYLAGILEPKNTHDVPH